MRFPIYESLYLLNRNLQETIDLLDQIQNSPRMGKQKFKAYQVEIECLRAEATQDVLEIMNGVEIHEMSTWSRQKKAYEVSLRDPNDIYLEVQQREAERRRKGLPPLIGVLPRTSENFLAVPEVEPETNTELPTSASVVEAHANDKTRGGVSGPKAKKNGRNTNRKAQP